MFLEWADWVMRPRCFFDDPTLDALENFPRYRGALRAICLTDDPWGTPPAVDLLCSGFTGTVPDYTSTAKGLLLGGVVGGGPADQAGLQKGDVIVEIAGQSIANIYDYTYALELLKIGQPASVTYVRNGERRQTTLTPSARR